MKVTPWILGAAALVPFAGAYAGANIGSEPLTNNRDINEILPSRPTVAEAAPRQVERLPSHYDMETPEGTVEVAELSFRGRYSQYYRDVEPADFVRETDMAALESHYRERGKRDYAYASRDPYRASRERDVERMPQTRAASAQPAYTLAYAGTTQEGRQVAVAVPHYEAVQAAQVGSEVAEVAQQVAAAEPPPRPVTGPRVIDVAAALRN